MSLYLIAIELAGIHLPAVELVACPTKYAFLGRDVLNRFVINLDGPGLAFDLFSPP
ncbi:MAG: hypothetical protein ACUVV0_12350 [Anaerolineae bacterium]